MYIQFRNYNSIFQIQKRAPHWAPFNIRKRGVFCPGKAVEGLRGGVVALRRTSDPEYLRSQGRKEPFPLLQILLDPFHRLNHILVMAKGREPEEPFPGWAEAGARRADHVALVQELVEEVP